MAEPTFEEFVRASLPALGRYAYVLTGDRDAAADLVQDSLERLARAWRRVRADGNPLAYARVVMVRCHVSTWRALSRRPPQAPLHEHPGEADPFAGADARDAVRRALATLPRSQRAVLVLTYLEGRPDVEIAEALGCRAATVRSLRHRALRALRAAGDPSDATLRSGNG